MLRLLLPLLLAAPAAACAEKPVAPAAGTDAQGRGVADLPFAEGRVFYSLDEYLAFRRQAGAYDVPWFRRVGADQYELVAQPRPGVSKPKRFTRAELMRRFGFTR